MQMASQADDYLENIAASISLLSFFLGQLIALLYFLSGEFEYLHYQISLASFILLIPYIISRFQYKTLAAICLCYILPLLIMTVSIINKTDSMTVGIIDGGDYFDVRYLLISNILVPMTTIPLKKYRLLLAGILPSFVLIIFFDPIHFYFGVDYYQAGLTSVDYYISSNSLAIISYLFLGLAFLLLKFRVEKSLDLLTSKNNKQRKYIDVLVGLGNSNFILNSDAEKSYEEIVSYTQKALGVSSVSIWEFDENYEKIECVLMNELGEIKTNHTQLLRQDYKNYFTDILDKKIVIAENARENPATTVFKDEYLNPNNIYSMMDVAFIKDGKIAGIICCEHYHEIKQWELEDSIFLKAMADLISFMHANKKQQMRKTELEKRVHERTLELEEKNKQLQEYAYINSHVLRAPVSRIHGLMHLLESEKDTSVNLELLKHFKVSILELDEITKQINSAIADLGVFDRNQLERSKNIK